MASKFKKKKEETYKRSLAEIIEMQARDDKFDFVTVTGLELSADLRYAKVFLDIPGGNLRKERVLAKFNDDSGFFRSQLASKVDPRYTPELTFILDKTRNRVARIEKILREDDGDEDASVSPDY